MARSSNYYQEKERIAKQSSRHNVTNKTSGRFEIKTLNENKGKMQNTDLGEGNTSLELPLMMYCHNLFVSVHVVIKHGLVIQSPNLLQAFVYNVQLLLWKKCITSLKSKDGKEWICRTCLSTLKVGKMQNAFIVRSNKMSVSGKPHELDLHQLV